MQEVFRTYSHSQRQLFAECPRLYQYRYLEKLREEESVSASFSSTCLHPVLQALHTSVSPATMIPEALWLARELYEEWARGRELELLSHPECSLTTLEKVVRQYAPMVEADREEGWECVGVEERCVLPAHAFDLYLRYTAKVDVLEMRGEERRVVECKFSASQVEKPWGIDNQLIGYAAAAGVEEVMLVEVRMRGRKRGEAWKVDVVRGTVRFAPDLIEEWVEEMEQERRALLAAWESDVWPKHAPSACWRYGKPCAFVGLCQQGKARRFSMESMRALVEEGDE